MPPIQFENGVGRSCFTRISRNLTVSGSQYLLSGCGRIFSCVMVPMTARVLAGSRRDAGFSFLGSGARRESDTMSNALSKS